MLERGSFGNPSVWEEMPVSFLGQVLGHMLLGHFRSRC